jgi:hypothetical protein
MSDEIKAKWAEIRKNIIASIDIATKQNKAIQITFDNQYKLLKLLAESLKNTQSLMQAEEEYLKEKQ